MVCFLNSYLTMYFNALLLDPTAILKGHSMHANVQLTLFSDAFTHACHKLASTGMRHALFKSLSSNGNTFVHYRPWKAATWMWKRKPVTSLFIHP